MDKATLIGAGVIGVCCLLSSSFMMSTETPATTPSSSGTPVKTPATTPSSSGTPVKTPAPSGGGQLTTMNTQLPPAKPVVSLNTYDFSFIRGVTNSRIQPIV